MKTYIGTKLINAKPMSRQDYNDFRGWILPGDEDGSDEGYIVEYLDGGKPNTETHAWYVTWSPKEQFEKAYRECGAAKQRVELELESLIEKADALENYLNSEADTPLILTDQLNIMNDYANILMARLDAWVEA